MSPGMMLSSLLIGPLKLLFEFIFSLANRLGRPGLSIVALSLCVNLLVLPLYRRADAIQEEERQAEARLAPEIAHIRKYFRGDQRFMTLQTLYRQHHYSQAHALKGLLPLMLEIPFFIAAYQFLSGLELLKGAPFGPIRDLGRPDGLLALGGLSVNLLPVLMTGINLLSGALYTRGAPLKSRIQLYAMAAVFLVLLYDSPAGLTLYWTLNNLFSLVKNLLTRGAPATRPSREEKGPAFLRRKPNPGLFFLGCAFAALLTGVLIPSAVISSSPEEFLDAGALLHPFWYVANSALLAAGAFPVWFGVFYLLSRPRVKKAMELMIGILALCMLVNYMAFPARFGTLSSVLRYERLPQFTLPQKAVNLLALLAAGGLAAFLFIRREKLVRSACLVGALAVAGMSVWNLAGAAGVVRTAADRMAREERREISFPLSRGGRNTVLLMLDRSISSFLPCILAEKPEAAAALDGFVWYPNTLSHGMSTNFGLPGIFGGYDYTPWEMNQRPEKTIPEKHDEALLLLPTLFSEAGYTVTVADPPFAGGYNETPNLSIYDSLPNTFACVTQGMFSTRETSAGRQGLRFRNLFCYALCETAPLAVYGALYNTGFYNQVDEVPIAQTRVGLSLASGVDPEFLLSFDVLTHLADLSEIRDSAENTLLLMTNTATHEPLLLSEPDYLPARHVDNRQYDAAHADRFSAGPKPLRMENDTQMSHYHVNAAALLQVGAWLDWMKENGVYDNTRIVIVGDHGENLGLLPEAVLPDGEDLMNYNPLLLVKDFGSRGPVRTDPAFMTNADVPAILAEGQLEHPVNPFTGRPLLRDAKREPQKVTVSENHFIYLNRGRTFKPAAWYEVDGEPLNPERWTPIGVH